jgi:hypothetical protein
MEHILTLSLALALLAYGRAATMEHILTLSLALALLAYGRVATMEHILTLSLALALSAYGRVAIMEHARIVDEQYIARRPGEERGVLRQGTAELRAFQIWARYGRGTPRDIGEI